MVRASHFSKSSTANFGAEVWKWSNDKLSVWSPLHCYLFPEEEVVCLTVTFVFVSLAGKWMQCPMWARCDAWIDRLFADGLQKQENCPTLPLHAQDVAKCHVKPQWHHRKHKARDEEYLIFPESWGEDASSQCHACYCWAYTQKWGIRQRRGLCNTQPPVVQDAAWTECRCLKQIAREDSHTSLSR